MQSRDYSDTLLGVALLVYFWMRYFAVADDISASPARVETKLLLVAKTMDV